MASEVRIRLRSTRIDSEASLFPEDAEGIQQLNVEADPEPEHMEINAIGKRHIERGRVEISYRETEVTGMDGSTTAVSFMIDQPEVVTMTREGTVSTTLVFEEGKRHHCLYNTPYMPFEVCVHTLKVQNRLSKERYLELDYIVEIRGARAERTKFRMELL